MKGKFVLIGFTIFGVVIGWTLHSLFMGDDRVRTLANESSQLLINQDLAWSNVDDSVIADLSLHALSLRSSGEYPAQVALFDKSGVEIGNRKLPFDLLLKQVSIMEDKGDFSVAIEILLQAALVASGEIENQKFESALARIVDRASKELVSQQRFGVLDQLYERLTLKLPELAEYYLKLGLLRIRMGNEPGAFQPLAQIQNHTQYGAQARQLLIQLEESQTYTTKLIDEIPLTVMRGQFVVEAIVDPDRNGKGATIQLLVDTGAAMTAIDATVLARLGYDLEERTEYFATANGVVEAPVVTLGALMLGKSTISRLSIGALNLGSQSNIDGLLGMNFLRHFEFRLNQESQKLELQRRED
ncbi:MAG: clan AA aspartic protease (TIGR02281 family) [Candidatus Azotimanducaceae bacterium]|jgi:clan AA aspartic protease (TIGR02281 family)